MKAKTLLAVGAIVVYVTVPAYRYWMIGTWVGYKIMNDKGAPIRTVPKGSRQYKRIVQGGV